MDGICGNQTVLCSSVRPFRYITINLAHMLRRFPINPFFNAFKKKGVYKVFQKKKRQMFQIPDFQIHF